MLQESFWNALAELEEALPRVFLERTQTLFKILDCITIRAKPGPELGPGERRRHGGACPGAGRIGGDRRGPTRIPQVVHEDLPHTIGLGERGRVVVGETLHHFDRYRPRELLEHAPWLARSERDDHVKALAAGCLDEGRESQLVEDASDPSATLDDSGPIHAGAGIQIEDHAVRLLEPVHPGAPWMDLEHSHLSEADQASLVLHEQILAPRLFLHDGNGLQMLGYPRSRVLLEEARLPAAFRAPEKTQGALHDVRKYPGADPVVEFGEVSLGQPPLGIEHAIGMRQRHSGDFSFAWRPRLLRDHQDILLGSWLRRARDPRGS